MEDHFSEINRDVGMSFHGKERGTRGYLHQNRNSFVMPYLHLCLLFVCVLYKRILGGKDELWEEYVRLQKKVVQLVTEKSFRFGMK